MTLPIVREPKAPQGAMLKSARVRLYGLAAMDRIERVAELTILRALGFTALGIGTLMLGLSYEAALCFQTGAILVIITAVVLAFRAWEAPTRNIRNTELYIVLDGELGMPLDRAQAYVGSVLRRLYARFARIAAGLGVCFWLLSVIARLA